MLQATLAKWLKPTTQDSNAAPWLPEPKGDGLQKAETLSMNREIGLIKCSSSNPQTGMKKHKYTDKQRCEIAK